jgi:hypothetical protein
MCGSGLHKYRTQIVRGLLCETQRTFENAGLVLAAGMAGIQAVASELSTVDNGPRSARKFHGKNSVAQAQFRIMQCTS